ncbi:MAG TPA: transcriptional regulator [Planctomycetaceae bacterium]|nr:transcriptional regulator [Planctomycetaceae bacterium]
MRQLMTIVKPFVAEKVVEALSSLPIEALTVREAKGFGRQKNYLAAYGDDEYSMAFLPKVEISFWIETERAEEAIRVMLQAARTGRMGDGKILSLPVEREIVF